MEIFDVVVVGAGPAGGLAGFRLCQLGLKVAIVEKAEPPRYKTCGGGITPKATPLIPFPIRETSERDCYEAELCFHSSHMQYGVKRDVPIVHMVMRDQFDYRLLEMARGVGASIYSKCAVEGISREGEFWRIRSPQLTLLTRAIVGADGAQSTVAKKAGFRDDRVMAPALEYEVEVTPQDFERYRNKMVIDFEIVPRGYGWIFPKRKHLSIGVGRVLPSKVDLNECYQRYLAKLQFSKILKQERHGYMVPIRPRKTFVKDGIFLVGDAAGFADALTAEGIGNALQSAHFVAEAFRITKGKPITATEGLYRSLVRRELLKPLHSSRKIAYLIYGFPKIRNFLFRRRGHRLAAAMCDVMSGERPYPSIAKVLTSLAKSL